MFKPRHQRQALANRVKVFDTYNKLRAERPGYISINLIAEATKLSQVTVSKAIKKLKINLLDYTTGLRNERRPD